MGSYLFTAQFREMAGTSATVSWTRQLLARACPPPPAGAACGAAHHRINTGKGGAVRSWQGEGVPQELLQGQKFTVVSISPFHSQWERGGSRQNRGRQRGP